MDKRVVLAAAGSGKTSSLVKRLNSDDRFLIVTYTVNNEEHLRTRIIERFGCIPENIRVMRYFSFLNGFCFKPFLSDRVGANGITFDAPPGYTRYKENTSHYMDNNKRLYHNRIAKLVQKGCLKDVLERLSKYFDWLLIDEAQDFGGHDLNFLCALGAANLNIVLVGDFYQHTFETSADGNVNVGAYKDFNKYLGRLIDAGFTPDQNTLIKSYRCSPAVCKFVRDSLGIQIESHRTVDTDIIDVDNQERADKLFADQSVVKLFLEESSKYPCYSDNWGNSKGQDHYNDVCVVLNPTSFKSFQDGTLVELKPKTKGKLYVACTRARGNLYFVPEKYFKKFKKDA